jgi:hypothetical protein
MTGPDMIILLSDNAKPLKPPGAKLIPHHWKAEADRMVKDMLDRKVIRRCKTPTSWLSAGFFVGKPHSETDRLQASECQHKKASAPLSNHRHYP